MNSKRLSELRYKGHITDSEYEELKLAIKALEDERPQGELANEVWKLYKKHQSHLATYVYEFGIELQGLLGRYGGRE